MLVSELHLKSQFPIVPLFPLHKPLKWLEFGMCSDSAAFGMASGDFSPIVMADEYKAVVEMCLFWLNIYSDKPSWTQRYQKQSSWITLLGLIIDIRGAHISSIIVSLPNIWYKWTRWSLLHSETCNLQKLRCMYKNLCNLINHLEFSCLEGHMG